MKINDDIIAGYIMGEGCFTFHKNSFSPCFTIKCHVKDIELIKIIKDRFGGIDSINSWNNGKYIGYTVGGINNCKKIISILNGKIYGDKKIDFDNWKYF